jgi:L-asparagine transporter-like permease
MVLQPLAWLGGVAALGCAGVLMGALVLFRVHQEPLEASLQPALVVVLMLVVVVARLREPRKEREMLNRFRRIVLPLVGIALPVVLAATIFLWVTTQQAPTWWIIALIVLAISLVRLWTVTRAQQGAQQEAQASHLPRS